jgi:tight adherence protein B
MNRPLGAFLAVPAALLGTRIAGPVGFVVGAAATAALPTLVARRSSRNRREALERQLADLVESSSLAVRTGLSMVQALEFATQEADEPMAGLARRMAEEQQVGVPFEIALQHLGESLDTEDARLFTLVVGVHARSGGNLAGALDEVGSTVRHRIAVRRELRAFSAQGRVSGAILGSLPIAFFLVLAAASRRELGPVYRSAPGIAMVVAGFVMEGLAFLLIRRLLRVEI